MPDCKETSAQVPLYNEIQATTTFASLALFFFMSSLQKSRGGARTTAESRARGRAAAKYYDVAAATDAHATSRDGGFLRATQRHRRDMQHHFGAQLKGSFRGTSGARLVPPRSGAPRSAESHRRENTIATSAKRASDKYFYKLRGPRQQRWRRASSEVVTKKLGNSGRANARAPRARRMRLWQQAPATKFPYYPRKRIWRGGGGSLAACGNSRQVCAQIYVPDT